MLSFFVYHFVWGHLSPLKDVVPFGLSCSFTLEPTWYADSSTTMWTSFWALAMVFCAHWPQSRLQWTAVSTLTSTATLKDAACSDTSSSESSGVVTNSSCTQSSFLVKVISLMIKILPVVVVGYHTSTAQIRQKFGVTLLRTGSSYMTWPRLTALN